MWKLVLCIALLAGIIACMPAEQGFNIKSTAKISSIELKTNTLDLA